MGRSLPTPYTIALNRFLLENGPSTETSLIDYVAKHVPVGRAVNHVYTRRMHNRARSGRALDVPPQQVADKYETRQIDPVASGARAVAKEAIRNRLRSGTVFLNADGLLQHRDWRPGGAS